MPENDLDLLINAAKDAGEIALEYAGRGFDVKDKPGGAGPVTEADIAVDTALRTALTHARPDYGWLSEETTDTPERLSRNKVFVVDPIDGTRSFIKNENTWAHSLAIVENGVVTHGVVYLPAMDQLYAAEARRGATLNGEPMHASHATTIAEAQILATKPNLDPKHWRGSVPHFRRSHRPSLAYRLSLVAAGRYDAMLTFRPSWEWDIAAGAVILSEAGARVTDRAGADLRFNNPAPQTAGIVGASEQLHTELMQALVYSA